VGVHGAYGDKVPVTLEEKEMPRLVEETAKRRGGADRGERAIAVRQQAEARCCG
jgi:hypothetical protein